MLEIFLRLVARFRDILLLSMVARMLNALVNIKSGMSKDLPEGVASMLLTVQQGSPLPVGIVVVEGGSSETDSENDLLVQLGSLSLGSSVWSAASAVIVLVMVTTRAFAEWASAEASANTLMEARMLSDDYEKRKDEDLETWCGMLIFVSGW
jgi:hypothetical protein